MAAVVGFVVVTYSAEWYRPCEMCHATQLYVTTWSYTPKMGVVLLLIQNFVFISVWPPCRVVLSSPQSALFVSESQVLFPQSTMLHCLVSTAALNVQTTWCGQFSWFKHTTKSFTVDHYEKTLGFQSFQSNLLFCFREGEGKCHWNPYNIAFISLERL